MIEKDANKIEVGVSSVPEVAFNPMADTGMPDFLLPMIPFFNKDLYSRNDRLVRLAYRALTAMSEELAYLSKRTMYPLGKVRPQEAIKLIENLMGQPTVDDSIMAQFGHGFEGDFLTENPVDYMTRSLREFKSKKCFVSRSHEADLYIFEALIKLGIPPEQIGIIIFDQHIDAQTKTNPKGMEFKDKSNFLRFVLDQGVGAISIFGLGEREVLNVISEINPLDKYADDPEKKQAFESLEGQKINDINLIRDFYQEFKDRISLASGYFNKDRQISNPTKLVQVINDQIHLFKSMGIKYVLTSFDLDSLNLMSEKITATPYNPISTIIAAGLQYLEKALFVSGMDEKTFTSYVNQMENLRLQINALQIQKQRKGILKPSDKTLLEEKQKRISQIYTLLFPILYIFEKSTKVMAAPKDSLVGFPPIQVMGSEEGGFSVKQAELAISELQNSCKANGLEFGIPIENGRLTGSISELSFFDFEENTAKAVRRIAQALNA